MNRTPTFSLVCKNFLLFLIFAFFKELTAANDSNVFCTNLIEGKTNLLAMGLLDGYLYILDTTFKGARVAKEKLYNDSSTASVDLLTTEMVNLDWSISLPSEFKSSNASGILFMGTPDPPGKPSIVVFSANKEMIVTGTLSGPPGVSDGRLRRIPATVTDVFFSLEGTEAYQAALFDSDSGTLTFTTLGSIIGASNKKGPPNAGKLTLPSGLSIDGGFISGNLTFAYSKINSLIIFFDGGQVKAKIPYKQFFLCSGRGNDFGMMVTTAAGGVLLIGFIICGVCIWKANKYALNSLKSRKTKSTKPTARTVTEKKTVNEKSSPVSSSAMGTKSSKIGKSAIGSATSSSAPSSAVANSKSSALSNAKSNSSRIGASKQSAVSGAVSSSAVSSAASSNNASSAISSKVASSSSVAKNASSKVSSSVGGSSAVGSSASSTGSKAKSKA